MVNLRELGIKGKVAIGVEEWLGNKKQMVVLNGVTSDWGDIHSGVVQGPVLAYWAQSSFSASSMTWTWQCRWLWGVEKMLRLPS